MSLFLEILGCILCCEEKRHDDSDDETSDPLIGISSATPIYISNWTSRSINYEQRCGRGSTTSDSASTGYASTERISQSRHGCSNYTPSSTSRPPSTSPLLPAAVPPSVSKPTTVSTYTPSSTSRPPSISPTSSSKPSSSPLVPAAVPPPVSKPTTPVSKPSTSSSQSTPASLKSSPASLKSSPCFKVTLSPASSSLTSMEYVLYGKDPLPTYTIPEDIKDLIKKDIAPEVLYKPLQPSTYKDHFAALLYAEDHCIEKWSDFQLVNVAMELHKAAIYRKLRNKEHLHEIDGEDNKLFAAFKVDSVPEKRPFLLSRDFVFAKPTGRKVDPFQGIIYRVVKSTTVLVEFAEDFYSQHRPNRRYDISFSFNRVCLKRAHQAVSAASDPLFQDYIFPDSAFRKIITASAPLISSSYKLDSHQNSAIRHILSFQGPPPYLVEGPLCVSISKQLSKSGMVVQEAVLKIYKGSSQSRILICAPTNSTCDVLMRGLKKEIPESHMFRANAAFRELDGVPVDILPSCLHKDECFSCPPLKELRAFRVILSTFVSSFRLRNVGITAGHFSHIFLVDASSATEPETMIALTNMANEKTAVIVTGAPKNRSGWVRSNIARKNGLRVSYFERLRESRRYCSLDPMFITQLEN